LIVVDHLQSSTTRGAPIDVGRISSRGQDDLPSVGLKPGAEGAHYDNEGPVTLENIANTEPRGAAEQQPHGQWRSGRSFLPSNLTLKPRSPPMTGVKIGTQSYFSLAGLFQPGHHTMRHGSRTAGKGDKIDLYSWLVTPRA